MSVTLEVPNVYDPILVPVDGSDHAVRAAEHGLGLARAFDATVRLLTVVDVGAAGGPFNAGGVDSAFVERLERGGEQAIANAVDEIGAEDGIETAVVRGEPGEAILEYATEHDVELIAMGTHGRTGIERYILGSVTERVVRRAEVPVFTVRATDRSQVGGYDEILVPTDGSEFAAAAVEHAVSIARQFDARVHVLTVVDLGDIARTPDYMPPAELIERLENAGEDATERIAAQVRDADLEATTRVRDGHPAKEILAYSDEHDVDLIAMGTAGRTGPSRFLLGSTTERIVRHAEVPVLAVNARRRETEQ
jgi:nucleotide-binding universal stress UspA family protein